MRILAVNPGASSTKVGVYVDGEAVLTTSVSHAEDELAGFRGRPVLEQLEFRLDAVRRALDAGLGDRYEAVVGRGGLLRPLAGGTYRVTDAMLDDLRAAGRGEHASNLGAFLAARLGEEAECPAFVVDPVSVDEWDDVARLSGLKGLDRESLSHALNTRAVAHRYAAEVGRAYGELRLVVAHLGSGITVSAHRDGRMVDATNSREEGPFSMERAGSVPTVRLVRRVLEAGLTAAEAERMLFGDGGVHSYLGTRDLRELLRRIDAGDPLARQLLDAMLYQVRKACGAMAAVLEGRVDAVLLTGGMAHAAAVTEPLAAGLAWIGPVRVYPGEDELRALAEGAGRVVRGEEEAREY